MPSWNGAGCCVDRGGSLRMGGVLGWHDHFVVFMVEVWKYEVLL